MVDRVAAPGLAQDLHHLAAPLVAERSIGATSPGKSDEITFSVSLPCSMWSSVATVRASIIGCISPQRIAASMLIRLVIGAQPATKLSVSWPT